MDPSSPIEWIAVLLYPTAAVLLGVVLLIRGPVGRGHDRRPCRNCGRPLQQQAGDAAEDQEWACDDCDHAEDGD